MRSQGFSQFYLHTPRTSANGMNHTCLCLPSQSWYSFTDPGGMEGWVGLGWLVGYVPKWVSGIGNWTRTWSPISVLTWHNVERVNPQWILPWIEVANDWNVFVIFVSVIAMDMLYIVHAVHPCSFMHIFKLRCFNVSLKHFVKQWQMLDLTIHNNCQSVCTVYILLWLFRVTTNLETLEYSGISTNMEKSGNSVQLREKFFYEKFQLDQIFA